MRQQVWINEKDSAMSDLPPVPGEFTRLKIPLFDGLGLTAIVVQMCWASPALARCVGDTRCILPSTARSYVLPLLYSQTSSGSSTLLATSR